jgi:hypothetical protein
MGAVRLNEFMGAVRLMRTRYPFNDQCVEIVVPALTFGAEAVEAMDRGDLRTSAAGTVRPNRLDVGRRNRLWFANKYVRPGMPAESGGLSPKVEPRPNTT